MKCVGKFAMYLFLLGNHYSSGTWERLGIEIGHLKKEKEKEHMLQ